MHNALSADLSSDGGMHQRRPLTAGGNFMQPTERPGCRNVCGVTFLHLRLVQHQATYDPNACGRKQAAQPCIMSSDSQHQYAFESRQHVLQAHAHDHPHDSLGFKTTRICPRRVLGEQVHQVRKHLVRTVGQGRLRLESVHEPPRLWARLKPSGLAVSPLTGYTHKRRLPLSRKYQLIGPASVDVQKLIVILPLGPSTAGE